MQKPSDELLVAYLDGELDDAQRAEVEGWVEHDGAARDRLARLSETTTLVRAAFDEILRDDVPERLIDAARGVGKADAPREAAILPFRVRSPQVLASYRRWWVAVPIAASFFGLVIGGGVGYVGLSSKPMVQASNEAPTTQAAASGWLDNVAEYHKLFVNASSSESSYADIPANADGGDVMKKISHLTAQQASRVPNLKPWGLNFVGARAVVVESRTAAQLVYTADNEAVGKAIGPLTVLIASTKRPEVAPTFEHRQDVNMLYWRRKGHAYVIVGQADTGYLWGLANDIAWQLDAI
jgi:anti-sigma factor RsiW